MYTNLKAEMFKSGISDTYLANTLKITKHALIDKIDGRKEFTLKEIQTLLHIFTDCTFEYLFFHN